MNKKLNEWISLFNTIDDAAEAIGVHPSSVSKWVRGVRNISAINCLKISRLTNGRLGLNELRPDLLVDEDET